MGRMFDPEGKFMHYGGKLWDMIWLNILWIVFSLPVITAGGATSAMHYVLIQLYRDEEGKITRAFCQAFRENLKNSTLLTLLFSLLVYALSLSAGIAASGGTKWAGALLLAMMAAALCTLNWSLIFQARYRNSLMGTIRLGVLACLSHPLRSLVMEILALLPAALLAVAPENGILVALVGFSLPGFVQIMLCQRVFRHLETSPETSEEQTADIPDEA